MRNVLVLALAAVIAPAAMAQTMTIEFGFVSASGNTTLETLNFGDKIVLKARSWTFTQQASYIFGKTNSLTTANLLRASVRGDKTFADRVGFFVGSQYERNRFAGFTMHTDQIAGISALVLSAARDTLRVDAGGAYSHEKLVDGTSKSFPAGRGALAYKHSFGGSSAFAQTLEYVPNLEETAQFRLNAETGITASLTTHVAMKVSHLLRYDSRPPTGGFRKVDRVLTTGLQVTY